ncbi:MAG: hypothetical protein RLZZ292_586 [Bacteroidota bacterium]|jgi:hypothetical protein
MAIPFLLEKYFQGDTSLEEEEILRRYFNSDEVATELRDYVPLFKYLNEAKKTQLSVTKTTFIRQSIEAKNAKTIQMMHLRNWVLRIAAVLVLMVGSFVVYHHTVHSPQILAQQRLQQDTYDNPKEALEAVQLALALVAKKMNKGSRTTMQQVAKLGKIGKIGQFKNSKIQ